MRTPSSYPKFLMSITQNLKLLAGNWEFLPKYYIGVHSDLLISVFIIVTRAECEHNPVQFFAILSMQRSGSGWFETLLNSHVNVSSNGEIFSVKDRRINISSVVQTLDKVYNLDWFSSASKNQCSAAVGFKWMLNQVMMCLNSGQ